MSGEALLLAVGNHLCGLSRHHELASRDARLIAEVRTRASYRLLARGAAPSNPGLIEVGTEGGVAILGELYALPVSALTELAALTRSPIRLAEVWLDDGRAVRGYLCDPGAAATARDVSHHGGWRAFLAADSE